MIIPDLDAIARRNKPLVVCSLPAIGSDEREVRLFYYRDNVTFASETGAEFLFQPFQSSSIVISQIETTKEIHLKNVQFAINEIKTGKIDKVIISRVKHVNRSESFSLNEIFSRLLENYRAAFVYFMHHPAQGTWMGASPEVLLTKKQQQFSTVSLAGTLPYKKGVEVIWDEKLLHEQRLVTDFISRELNNLGIYPFEIDGPSNAIAGPLVHLKSTFTFQSELAVNTIISALHPTPAICGLPREASRELITSTEQHQRRLYTGYLGVNHLNGDADFFVNLRCMQIFEEHFELFVGGGITANSDPESEWQETEAKSKVLMNAIS